MRSRDAPGKGKPPPESRRVRDALPPLFETAEAMLAGQAVEAEGHGLVDGDAQRNAKRLHATSQPGVFVWSQNCLRRRRFMAATPMNAPVNVTAPAGSGTAEAVVL
jgi:hypothetical protein